MQKNPWTEEEIYWLEKNYSTTNVRECSRILGRSELSIRLKACRLRGKGSRRSARKVDQVGVFYLYVIGPEGGGPVKIGITKSPPERRKTLQTGSPVRLVVHSAICVSSDIWARARRVENSIHRHLRKHRMEGEWFNLTPSEAEAAVRALSFHIQAVPHETNLPRNVSRATMNSGV